MTLSLEIDLGKVGGSLDSHTKLAGRSSKSAQSNLWNYQNEMNI